MKKGTVLSLKKIRLSEFIIKNNVLVLLVLLFIAGIAVGTFAGERIVGLSDYSADYLERFVAERSDASFLSVCFTAACRLCFTRSIRLRE